ncbi:hypothetical protein V5O48_002761 [Marasmius crinis-equi]|uniref:Uncharacterized protein n=1 Tax=Marasmius crinis-equi TaxID=585013 RepID=A0ABR3FUS2_9AGAR
MPGEGSKSSPIFISDDDEEIQALPRQMASTSFSKPIHHDNSIQGLPPRPVAAAKSRTKTIQNAQNIGNGNLNEATRKRKRKREQSNQSIDATGIPNPTLPVSPHAKNGAQNAQAGSKSKKAKHSHRGRAEARRKAAEELAAAQMLSLPGNPQIAPFNPEHAINYSYSHSFPSYDPEVDPGYSSTIPDSDYHTMDDYMDDEDAYEAQLSSSDWVNSMARAADPPPDSASTAWDYDHPMLWPPPQPYDPGPSQAFMAPLPHPLPLLPSLLPQHGVLLPPPPSIPQPSSSSNHTATIPTTTSKQAMPTATPLKKIIGIPSDRDPDGKRSGFKLTPSTIFQSQSHVTYPHTPNRSNTIIMEQLPKQNRDPAFINSWAEQAAGAAPIFFAVDSSSAKALVEFATNQQARKAWSSPKLGKHLTSLSSGDLKGKPREDLIRVWWYKPPSPELVFTRVELEEGEIEDEQQPAEVVKKESKKERKARLAQVAREEKEKRRETAIHAAAILEEEKRAAKSEPVVPTSLPLLPTITSHLSPVPYPVPFVANPLQSVPWPALGQYYPRPPSGLPQQPPFIIERDHSPLPHQETESETNANAFVSDELASSGVLEDDVMSIDEADFPGVSADHSESEGCQGAGSLDIPSPPLIVADLPDVGSSLSSNAPPSESSSTMVTPRPSEASGTPPCSDSASVGPLSRSVTPPSEPRAMKNAPKAPTYTKRALLARQKELEERITRSKLELLQRAERRKEVSSTDNIARQQQALVSPIPPEEVRPELTLIPAQNTIDVAPATEETSPAKLVRENHLRNLVLASRRQKGSTAGVSRDDALIKAVPASNLSAPSVTPDPSSLGKAVATESPPSVPPPVNSTSSPVSQPSVMRTSLDDLAVSFITETIQTLRPGSGQSVTPLATSQAANYRPMSEAAELAARQKQLETRIAESKRLMDKLVQAKSKQEKDKILASLRELNRSANANGTGSAPQTPGVPEGTGPPPTLAVPGVQSTSTSGKPTQMYQAFNFECFWRPQSMQSGGVLILSDDEDEDE